MAVSQSREFNQSMVLREASIKDLSNIVELHAQSWRENYSDVLSNKYLNEDVYADRTKIWTARLTNPSQNQFILIAEIDSVFCGLVCVFGANNPKFGTIIDNLHVKSRIKGKGIGTKLLVEAAGWAATNYENDNLYLEVLEGNLKAIKFYESLGGERVDIAYWHTPCGNKVKELIYSWGSPKKLANKQINKD
jgi:ribosomal protein S18 acetylase RimI-like enzyme